MPVDLLEQVMSDNPFLKDERTQQMARSHLMTQGRRRPLCLRGPVGGHRALVPDNPPWVSRLWGANLQGWYGSGRAVPPRSV